LWDLARITLSKQDANQIKINKIKAEANFLQNKDAGV